MSASPLNRSPYPVDYRHNTAKELEILREENASLREQVSSLKEELAMATDSIRLCGRIISGEGPGMRGRRKYD